MKSEDGDKEGNRAMQYREAVRGNMFKSQIELFNKHPFLAFLKIGFLTLIPVIFFCFVAIASAEEATNVTSLISVMSSSPGWGLGLLFMVAAILMVTFFAIYFTLRDKEKWKDYPLAMPKGSVRALLAFSLIFLIAIMVILFGTFNEIISALLAILATIVGYYFGQKSVGAEPKPKTEAEEIEEKAKNYLDELKKI